MRKADKLALIVLFCTAMQLVVGVLVVRAQRAGGDGVVSSYQQAVINAEVRMSQQAVGERLAQLESLRLSERLAVLEKSAGEVSDLLSEIRKLAYGVIASVFGMIVAQAIQIRDAFKRRHRA